MFERQLIFESVLPADLDPSRFSKPIIDGIEQELTSKNESISNRYDEFSSCFFLVTTSDGQTKVERPKVIPTFKDDFQDDELVAFAENIENRPLETLKVKKERPNNPLFKYRRGVLSVSDISAQIWCEQQLNYKFLYPFVLNDEGEIKRVDDKAHMLRGTNLHLERELEIQEKVPVECRTREDSYAVRLLNMIQGLNGLLKSHKRNEKFITREMPVEFSSPN